MPTRDEMNSVGEPFLALRRPDKPARESGDVFDELASQDLRDLEARLERTKKAFDATMAILADRDALIADLRQVIADQAERILACEDEIARRPCTAERGNADRTLGLALDRISELESLVPPHARPPLPRALGLARDAHHKAKRPDAVQQMLDDVATYGTGAVLVDDQGIAQHVALAVDPAAPGREMTAAAIYEAERDREKRQRAIARHMEAEFTKQIQAAAGAPLGGREAGAAPQAAPTWEEAGATYQPVANALHAVNPPRVWGNLDA